MPPAVSPADAASRRPGALLALSAGSVALIAFEILRIYWIMPFPGSQEGGTLGWAWLLHRAAWLLRPALWLVIAVAAARAWATRRVRSRVLAALALVACGLVTWQANARMSAEAIFRQPVTLSFAKSSESSLPPDALVLGIVLDGRARAYPIRYIGYHHQVRDVVAGKPVMVTYCTVCRTGRVFSPVVEGRPDDFRLVGMDRWNAMFEDSRTGSWWRQATGEAVAGPMKGARLEELPSAQASWSSWLSEHPDSDVMEPDPAFAPSYERMPAFEQGTNESRLTGRDEASWGEKSWVVGVVADEHARAFDWNELVTARALSDRVGDVPVALILLPDGVTFRAFDARWPGGIVVLSPDAASGRWRDSASGTIFTDAGVALDGPHAGARLRTLAAYQEFWHSWRDFRPGTSARRAAGS